MARSTFYADAGTTFGDVLTAAAAADTIIMAASLVNIDGTTAATGTVRYTDSSDSDTPKEIAVNINVDGGDVADILSKPILLKAGDKLQVSASAASDIAISGWLETFDV
jgi:hypothetical protein